MQKPDATVPRHSGRPARAGWYAGSSGSHPGRPPSSRRGFRWDSEEVRARLEGVAARFVEGYHAALEESRLDGLAARLEEVPAEPRGFAYEGAAMALALLDTLTPWRPDRLGAFLARRRRRPTPTSSTSAPGWVLARLPLAPERAAGALRPGAAAGWRSTATASTRASSAGRGPWRGRRSRPRSAATRGGPSTRGSGAASGSSRGRAPSASHAPHRRLPRRAAGRPLERRRARRSLRRGGAVPADATAPRSRPCCGRPAGTRRSSPRAPPSPPWPGSGATPRRTPSSPAGRLGARRRAGRRARPSGPASDLPPDGAEPALRGLAPAHSATLQPNEGRRHERAAWNFRRLVRGHAVRLAARGDGPGPVRLRAAPGACPGRSGRPWPPASASSACRCPHRPGDLRRTVRPVHPEPAAHRGLDLARRRRRRAERPRRRRPAERRLPTSTPGSTR